MQTDETLSARVAEEIRVLLVRRRSSARQLAQKVGLSQSAMSARLTGVTPIDLNELAAIADALDVAVEALLPKPAHQANKDGINGTYAPSADRPAAHAPDVRSRANRGTRTADLRPGRPRQTWTHVGVTA